MSENKPKLIFGWKQKLALSALAGLVLIVIAFFVLNIVNQQKQRTSPSFDSSVPGTTVSVWTQQEFDKNRASISWFRDLWLSSTNFDSSSSYENVFQSADVYPDHKLDDIFSWRPYHENRGLEWLATRAASSLKARAVIVVESYNPGAVTAVDDLIDANSKSFPTDNIVRLWSGRTDPGVQGRVLVFHLEQPRYIDGLRLVLDTSLVDGWNCIDAIGLVRAE
jgi:hypothetical protein